MKNDEMMRAGEQVATVAYKNKWDNIFTGRTWCECGGCRGVVSRKAETCKHCGALFENMKNGKLVI